MGTLEGVQLGPYVIGRRLGKGTTGTVHYAFDGQTNQPVAVKFLAEHYLSDASMLALFVDEARACATLDHPHIVRALRTGKYEGRPFIVFEYVQGHTLQNLLQSGAQSEGACVWILRQMTQALRELARKEIVHQDLKPSNIIVEPGGNCRLVDLGFARQRGGMDWEGLAAGTALYMSPEQCRGGRGVKIDSRSDQYSLGATMYYAATGAPPFDGENDKAVMWAHLQTPLEPALQRNARLSLAFSMILSKMLAKDPAQRYTTPEALLMDLRKLNVEAKPPIVTGSRILTHETVPVSSRRKISRLLGLS